MMSLKAKYVIGR